MFYPKFTTLPYTVEFQKEKQEVIQAFRVSNQQKPTSQLKWGSLSQYGPLNGVNVCFNKNLGAT